jgi:uroporphyrinogen-III synthase
MSTLKGLRILNTRPHPQGKLLSEAIHLAEGIAIEVPTLSIEATDNPWFDDKPSLSHYSQMIFVSSNAVKYFFKTIDLRNDTLPKNILITAVGKATAQSLASFGIVNIQIPTLADSEHLLKLESLQQVKNQKILLVKGEGGRHLIEETLNDRGADLHLLSVYRRTLPKTSKPMLESLWHDDAVDIILLTSHHAMSNLFHLLGEHAYTWICNKPCLVISQRLGNEARLLGIQTIIVSDYDKIIDTLKGLSHAK